MHIVVFGAGAVGAYFGGRLAQAGENVTFIARGEHLRAMLANGLKVDSIKGDFTIHPVTATDEPSSLENVDIVLLSVKTWHVVQAARDIIPMLGPSTFVVPLENGVDAPDQLSEILGSPHVIGGLCRIASRIAAPGHIQHTGLEPSIAFGELDKRPSARTQDLLQRFQHAGVSAEIPADINVAMWLKFLFISAVSGVGSVTRMPVGQYRTFPGIHHMLESALQECYSVAQAHGVQLPPDSVSKTLAFIDTLPPETYASMQRDIIEGRPSELEAQNGAIVRMGSHLGVPTPVHSFIYNSLLPQEKLARSHKD